MILAMAQQHPQQIPLLQMLQQQRVGGGMGMGTVVQPPEIRLDMDVSYEDDEEGEGGDEAAAVLANGQL